MRGKGSFLSRPREQIFVALPGLVIGLLSVFLGYITLSALRYSAVRWMLSQNLEERLVEKFVQESGHFFLLFWILAALLLIGGIFWAWRVSFWIFGPLSRLEEELQAMLADQSKPRKVKVRENDALFPIFELINKLLNR
jgi:hypothetical protein